jgi:hypothetical protein
LLSLPLEPLLATMRELPRFAALSTACYRRYVGCWRVEEDRLYLEGFDSDVYDLVPRSQLDGWLGVVSAPESGLSELRANAGFARDPTLPPERFTTLEWAELRDGRTLIGLWSEKAERWRTAGSIDFEIDLFGAASGSATADGSATFTTQGASWIEPGTRRALMTLPRLWVRLPDGTRPSWNLYRMPQDEHATADGFAGWCFHQVDPHAQTLPLDQLETFEARPRPARLTDLMFSGDDPVFADWFSGTLRVVDPETSLSSPTTHRTMSWDNWVFARETRLDVRDGRIVATREHRGA